EVFVKAFKKANGQLNTIQQYYEFAWEDEVFGITEHEWMRYVGAYRNITRDDNQGDEPEDFPVLPLAEAKLAGTQRIDAHYIIQLIGDKATSTDGKQTVDAETLRIVYQHIEELSNMGDFEQAKLLRQFVEEELEPGKVSSDVNFDEAYEEWKRSKLSIEIYQISQEWCIDEVIFEKSIESYSTSNPEEIPYIDDITRTVDYDSIKHQKTSNQLEHNMELLKVLPEIVPKLKRKYK